MHADGIRDAVLPVAIGIVGIVVFFLVHPLQKFAFMPAMILALFCYFLTNYRTAPKPMRVLPVYLTALSLQFLHFTEEYVYGFHFRVVEIMEGVPPFDVNTFVAFNMIAYFLFLMGALGLYREMKWPMIFIWFFTFGGALGNAVWHPLLAVKVGGYFPGLFTSFAYLILGPILFMRLWEVRKERGTRR